MVDLPSIDNIDGVFVVATKKESHKKFQLKHKIIKLIILTKKSTYQNSFLIILTEKKLN